MIIVTEMAFFVRYYLVVSFADLVFANIINIFLCEATVGSHLLEVTLCEGVDVDPLVSAEQVIDGLIMATL